MYDVALAHIINQLLLLNNTSSVNFIYLNFHPLEIVPRYCDPQLQVGENYLYVFDFKATFKNIDV